jgi:hypothetical protein
MSLNLMSVMVLCGTTTGTGCAENSEVLPATSVAVAVINWPAVTAAGKV